MALRGPFGLFRAERGRRLAKCHSLVKRKVRGSVSTNPDPDHVTASDLGDLIGVSARAVSKLGARGIAVRAGPGRWKLRESVASYCVDLRRQARGMGGSEVVATAAGERGRLASAQADLIE